MRNELGIQLQIRKDCCIILRLLKKCTTIISIDSVRSYLTEKELKCLILTVMHGLTCKQAAEQLGITRQEVNQNKQRALSTLYPVFTECICCESRLYDSFVDNILVEWYNNKGQMSLQ